MARGSDAKVYITQKLKEVFGQDFLGEMGGKIYINAPEAGSKVQIAIAMTCPKNQYVPEGTLDAGAFGTVPAPVKAEISEDEKANVRNLLKELGF